nr:MULTISPECIES: hypothetical protein [unclassified Curtobacterium]
MSKQVMRLCIVEPNEPEPFVQAARWCVQLVYLQQRSALGFRGLVQNP